MPSDHFTDGRHSSFLAAWFCALALGPLLLGAAGCASPEHFLNSAAATGEEQSSTENGSGETSSGKEESSDKDHKPPKPRTVGQAFCAYFNCLHCPECQDDKENGGKGSGDKNGNGNGKGSGSGNGSGEKNGNGNGSGSGNGSGEKNGKGSGIGSQKNGSGSGLDSGNGSGSASSQGSGSGSGSGEEKPEDDKKDEEKEENIWMSAHGQATMVTQYHDHFHSPYQGANSLIPVEPAATSATATLFLAYRLWESDEHSGILVFDPEMAGGTGFSGVMGMAGFPNGEITRVGDIEPTPYVARLYLQETIGFGGETEKVEDSPNQIAGHRDVDRLTFFIGKMSATDLVDDNSYSHDPRSQFLNWSLMYNGAWDYPANVRGYTYGVGIDFNQKCWAFRYGVYLEPATANGAAFDPHILEALGQVCELEERYELCCEPGKIRFLAYLNHANMGNYSEALAEMPVDPVIADTRHYRIKYGFGLNWQQEVTKQLGLFARLGWNNGQSESWAFTEIDRTACLGLELKGKCWCRPNDRVGLAFVANGLSSEHRDYLAAGGLGFIIGDGQLNYAPEEIVETYYTIEIQKGIDISLDFQGVGNPAYNADRGPLAVYTLRAHIEF
jgi:high affinity Mn2+ porin